MANSIFVFCYKFAQLKKGSFFCNFESNVVSHSHTKTRGLRLPENYLDS